MKLKHTHIHHIWKTYKALFVVLAFIIAYVLLRVSVRVENNVWTTMNDFMAGFFLAFGILELYTYRSFQTAFRKYDPIAKRFSVYAQIYPFLFIVFGFMLHVNKGEFLVSVLTVLLLGIQTIGILKVLRKGEQIQCACIGTAFALPLSWVTVFENVIMVFMALAMIISRI